MIYESRPNVTSDAAALCLKSGNACILRGGSEGQIQIKLYIMALTTGLEEVWTSERDHPISKHNR